MPSSQPSADLALLTDLSQDDSIMGHLPKTSVQTTSTMLDDSQWSRPLRFEMRFEGSKTRIFFVKVGTGFFMLTHGRRYRAQYDFVVEPLAYGSCSKFQGIHFYISEFKDLGEAGESLDRNSFCRKMAALHKDTSVFYKQMKTPPPEGKFGFHVVTHTGMLPHEVRWQSSWANFFQSAVRSILAFDELVHGPSNEFNELANELLNHIIPNLLRPLESNGRTVKPVLIHGDLQIRNVRTDRYTMEPVIFDAGSFWGHNECDLGKWRLDRFGLTEDFLEEYHQSFPKCEPIEDWHDRIILYSIRVNLISSAHYAANKKLREMAFSDIRDLAKRHGSGRRSRQLD